MESLICFTASSPFHCSDTIRFPRLTALASRSGGGGKHSPKPLQLPKNLRHRRRTEAPPDFHPIIRQSEDEIPQFESDSDEIEAGDGEIAWEPEEIEAISSLFRGRVPQKPGKSRRERPQPLPLPHRIRPPGAPAAKKLIRTSIALSRQPVSNRIHKNPAFLIGLAREIRSLEHDEKVSKVLDQWSRFLRKGSLSLTVRELGHMGLPGRASEVLRWAQNEPHLFPDDRTLASTVEVMARAHELRMPCELEKFLELASQSVYEAVVRGFVRGGNTRLACRLLSAAKRSKRVLSSSLYAKVILELGKCPDKRMLALPLLEELARRDDLELSQQDCTAIMKVCTRLGKFDVVEALYDWVKEKETGGADPGVVMYTTMIHSRFLEGRYRDAMAVVWEMEGSDCPVDLPAYRVLIRLFVASGDVSRAGRYFNKMKECGFAPTYDIYKGVIGIFMANGRFAKCREICSEAEMAGFKIEIEGM